MAFKDELSNACSYNFSHLVHQVMLVENHDLLCCSGVNESADHLVCRLIHSWRVDEDHVCQELRVVVLEHLGHLLHCACHLSLLLEAVEASLLVRPKVIHKDNVVRGIGAHALHCLLHHACVVELQRLWPAILRAHVRLENHGPVVFVHPNDPDIRHQAVALCSRIQCEVRFLFGAPLKAILQHHESFILVHVSSPKVSQQGTVSAVVGLLIGLEQMAGYQLLAKTVERLFLGLRRVGDLGHSPLSLGS
mmetsp:Transcript_13694/g.38780  ORF Transcript_13694/g.38780 Transcript_13694/m.38780 type:complete len:249 (-) Transcript_13694:777-1523(-)